MGISVIGRSLMYGVLVALLVFLVFRNVVKHHRPVETEAPRPVPEFHLKTLTGEDIGVETLKGKISVVTFWASWCEPCVQEMPSLQALYLKYKDKGVQVIGMNIEEEKDLPKVKLFLERNKITFPVVLDKDEVAADAFDVKTTIPHNFVIDRSAKIILEEEFPRQWDHPSTYAWLEEKLKLQ